MEYKYGITSFVEIGKFKANKHMPLDELYWSKEYMTLLYLWSYNHSNIIRYDSCSYINRIHPTKDITCEYYKITFPRYQQTLNDTTIYKDVDIIQIMVDLLSALSLCHSLNIWHRDIKPDNIMITKNTRAILIDFTHSLRIRTNELYLDKNVATYTHRAPEVFLYNQDLIYEYNEKIDIWALGVILYEMVINGPMYKKITINGREEQLDKFFNLKENTNTYLNKLYTVYIKKKRMIHLSKTYWKWIKSMLSYNADNRPSARKMLKIILNFARTNNMKIILPKYNNLTLSKEVSLTPYNKIRILNQLSYSKVHMLAETYSDICGMVYNKEKMYPIIKMLVDNNTIIKKNIHSMILALLLLISSVIYDHIIEIPYSLTLIKTNVKTLISKKNVHNSIIRLLKSHLLDLFLYPKFNFDNNIR